MITEDITIPSDGSWVTITATSLMSSIYNKGPHAISMRMGEESTSEGFIVAPSQMVVIDETCYVRSQKISSLSTYLVVTR